MHVLNDLKIIVAIRYFKLKTNCDKKEKILNLFCKSKKKLKFKIWLLKKRKAEYVQANLDGFYKIMLEKP